MVELSINLDHVLDTGVHLWLFFKVPQSINGKLFFQYGYSFKQKALWDLLSFLHTHITHVWIRFTYTLLSVTDMASSVKASLETSLSFVLLTGAKEPEWQGLSESPLLYDLRSFQQKSD